MTTFLTDPIVKLISALLLIVCIFFAIKHYNNLNEKVGSLETSLDEKNQLIETQNTNYTNLKNQVGLQAKAISDLQKGQNQLLQDSELRKINIKEVLNHDEEAKSWATQPVPNSIRSMFNISKTTESK